MEGRVELITAWARDRLLSLAIGMCIGLAIGAFL
jgi:hypothetical protein